MLIDSGSTSNYRSARCQTVLELEVRLEEDFEQLTLADGSKVHVQGCVQFVLHCGNCKTRILAQVFPNLHEELILGIPLLVQKNPTIDWAIGRVIIDRNGIVFTQPCHCQCLNKPEDREK